MGSPKDDWKRRHEQVKYYKAQYPPGTRILLSHMGEDIDPVPDNTRGTVRHVDDTGTLHCRFDNGRSLGVLPEEDHFRKLTEAELSEETERVMDEDDNAMIMGR